ncbi:protein lin-9 homolog [Nilaparvata lugens]|uniref:protein lin-9 homolog n=1 Tax=Nilaparvata lugens TaxID=108931 RepID=UPI000B993730|nr:protein lin-9 homolog [Nilaparvata lugens]
MADELELSDASEALLSFKNGGMKFGVEENNETGNISLKMEVDEEEEEEQSKPDPEQPVLNRRGMPQRIRKKNRLFFDDDVINPFMTKPRVKNYQTKTPTKSPKTPRSTPATPKTPKTPAVEIKRESPDRRLGQKIGMRLRNLLKLPKAHKWVCYEWFFSNIDKTLFGGDNDFTICLKETFPELKTRTLSRVEWCRMRRMMGKPRRCSQAFFDEERKELERKRTKIRLLQQRKSNDLAGCKELPDEIPLQLVIGSKVTARLRKPQDGIFTGCIDAVDTSNNTYRVTFERQGLGTHSVPDFEVLSNDPPETISIASYVAMFRPRPSSGVAGGLTALGGGAGGLGGSALKPVYPKLTLNDASSLTSAAHAGTGGQRQMTLYPIGEDHKIGDYPVKILEKIVRLNNILNIKRIRVDQLREMNDTYERKTSFNEPIPSDFQKQYAQLVIELEFINDNLKTMLNDVQLYCQEINPEMDVVSILTPVHLKERSLIDAREMVSRYHTELAPPNSKDATIIDLITDLTALMLQVKSLSESERCAYEVEVLTRSMDEIRGKLSAANRMVFENCVGVHMRHIQAGLTANYLKAAKV